MSALRNSILTIMAASNAATIINFLSSLVLARLLDPDEIGLFSMTAVFIIVMHTFRDFGVVSYLLREPDLTAEKVRSASGVMIFTSWSMAILMFLLATPVAHFYEHPQVAEIIRVLALGFVFIPFGSVTQSLLRREMQGGKQAVVTLVSTVVYASACIGLAAAGASYMSMAWANLINILASGIGYALVRPHWQPWLPSLRGWRNVARFGGVSAVSNLLTNIHTALPDTLLAKGTDARSVGLYSRANALVELFSQVVMPAVHNAIVPALANTHRERASIADDMLRVAVYLSGLAWPVFFVTAIFAADMIAVLYGDKWLACLPLVPYLCFAAALRMPFSQTSNALIAIGKPMLSVWTVGLSIVFKLAIALLSGADDMVGFVQAFLLGDLLVLPALLWVWRRQFGVGLLPLARAMLPTFSLTIACAASCLALNFLSAGQSPWLRLTLAAICMSLCWLGLVFLLRHPLQHEIRILGSKLLRRP